MHEPPLLRPGYVLGWELQTKKLRLKATLADQPNWAIDGTPVADESHLYVAMRYTDINPQAHVACFDLRRERLRWRTQVAWANTPAQGLAAEVTHNLLTLDHGVLYFNTNLGAVAAIGVEDGAVRWVTRYPRRHGERDDPTQLDLTSGEPAPCLFYHGLLLVAPSDSDQLFALDAVSGHRIWQTVLRDAAVDRVHLVGVVGDHLIASGRRLWWIDVTSGQFSRDVRQNPPRYGPPATLEGRGRAVVAGGLLYWPARGQRDEIHVVNVRTGEPAGPAIPLDLSSADPVHLLVAEGYLFVTTSDRIYAFPAARGREE
jgi:outer membrane protein assembly factor BamB